MEAGAPPPPPPPQPPPQAPPAPPPPGARVDVGRVIKETFSIYQDQSAPLIGTAFVVFLISGLLQGLLTDNIFLQLIGTIVSLLAQTLYTGFVVKLVEDVRDGRRDFSVGELLSSASPYLLPLIVNGFLKGIAVAIGLILFIVPGLFLLTIWAVTGPAIVIEKKDGLSAFSRSMDLTAGERMNVFLTILVVFLITIVVSFFVLAIGASLSTGILVVLSIFVATLVQPIGALVSAILFFDLRGGGAAAAEDRQVVVEY